MHVNTFSARCFLLNMVVHAETHPRPAPQAPASILGVGYDHSSGKPLRKTFAVTITSSSLSIQASALPQLNCKPPDAVDSVNIRIRFGECTQRWRRNFSFIPLLLSTLTPTFHPPGPHIDTLRPLGSEEDEVDRLKMTQFSETTCLITMAKGNDTYFIPLRDCTFASSVQGRRFHRNFRKRVPCRATQVRARG